MTAMQRVESVYSGNHIRRGIVDDKGTGAQKLNPAASTSARGIWNSLRRAFMMQSIRPYRQTYASGSTRAGIVGRGMFRLHTGFHTWLLGALLLLSVQAEAQPSLNFRGIGVSWPSVRLDFAVKCQGVWTHNFEKQQLRVFEDGVEVGDFELRCPDGNTRCSIAVALVLDASGSMGGEKNAHTRIAAASFIDNMDGVNDRAAVLWFQSSDSLVQSMTTDKALLKAAVDSLPAAGTTAVWDATWSAITELVSNGPGYDSCGAVIVLTDGNDNASFRTLIEVAQYALSRRVRIITVGVGADVNDVALKYLSSITGGMYYNVLNAEQLKDVYEDIFMDVAGIAACEIVYTGKCGDGTQRNVEIRIKNYCGGSDSASRTYMAPLEMKPATIIDIMPAGGTVKEGELLIVPVELLTTLDKEPWPVSEATVRFDTALFTFEGLGPSDGCLLASAGLRWAQLGDAVTVTTDRKVLVDGKGILFRLAFRARILDKNSCAPLSLEVWKFTNGCLKAQTGSVETCVETKRPLMLCSIEAPPMLRWNPSKRAYEPDSFHVTARYTNAGEKVLRNARFQLLDAASMFELLAPTGIEQILPGGDMRPGDSVSVRWLLRARPQARLDTVTVCIRGVFGNHPDLSCCARIKVEAADAQVLCAVSTPALTADSIRLRYDPSPLPLTVTVRNTGGRLSDTVRVAVTLPDGVTPFTESEAAEGLLMPPVLRGGESGVFTMRLRVTAAGRGALHRITTKAWQGASDTSRCEHLLAVPPLHAPVLEARCEVPALLTPDTAAGRYLPDEFDVRLHLKNIGDRIATQTAALLLPPPGIELADSTQPLRRVAVPSTLSPESLGGTASIITWRVRYARRSTATVSLPFQWIAWAADASNAQSDSVSARCSTLALPFPGSFTCALSVTPDTIVHDSSAAAMRPAAWTVSAQVTNAGLNTQRGVAVSLRRAASGGADFAEADPADDTSQTRSIPILFPGQTRVLSWSYRSVTPLPPSPAPTIVYALDITAEGEKMSADACTTTLFVRPAEAMDPVLWCALYAPDTLRFADSAYTPAELHLRVRAGNSGAKTAGNARAFVLQSAHFTIVSQAELALGDIPARSALDANANPGFLLRPTGGESDLRDTLRVLVLAENADPALCTIPVFLERRRQPRLRLDCALTPDTLRYDPALQMHVPRTLRATVNVHNDGDAPAYACAVSPSWGPRLLPTDSVLARSIPVLQPGDSAVVVWEFAPVTDSRDVSDTLTFGAMAVGADGRRVTASTCSRAVFIERSHDDAVQLGCAAPDSISMGSGVAFTFLSSVTNKGTRASAAQAIRIFLPPSVRLDAGETPVKTLAPLAPGGLANVSWRLLSDAVQIPAQHRICVELENGGGAPASCCASVRVVPVSSGGLSVLCTAPDTMRQAADKISYADNPFDVCLQIANSGRIVFDSVEAVILYSPKEFDLVSSQAVIAIGRVDTGSGAVRVCWRMLAIPAAVSQTAILRIMLRSAGREIAACERVLHFEAGGMPSLRAVLATTPPDTLHFDWATEDFEGVPSMFGSYTVFRVTAKVSNTGPAPARSVSVMLLPPEGVTLENNETAGKTLPNTDMAAGTEANVSWLLRAARKVLGEQRRFTIRVIANNAPAAVAFTDLFIQGAPRLAELRLPLDVTGRARERVAVPVHIEPRKVGAVRSYALHVAFDHTLLAFAGARVPGTLTASGWQGPIAAVAPFPGDTMTSIITIRDTALVLPIPRSLSGTLVELLFDVLYPGGSNGLGIRSTDLRFVNGMLTGESFIAGLNGSETQSVREIDFTWQNGLVTLTGDCIVPLKGSGTSATLRVAPNPFNASTRVTYQVTKAGMVRLAVYDALGRTVALLVDAYAEAGEHSAVFDASGLTSGMYRCRMITGDGSAEAMLLLQK